MSKPPNPNPAITRSTVARRESYQDWVKRRAIEEENAQYRAQREALRVMDMIDALRPAGASTPEVRALRIEEHLATPSMDQVIDGIRLQPNPNLHRVARNAQPYLALLGGALAFFAGLALGKAL